MSVIIFSDWNNYTEDGVPKVLDWNNLELYDYFIPMHAIVQALNERITAVNEAKGIVYTLLNINNYTLSDKLFYDVQTNIELYFDNFANPNYNSGNWNNLSSPIGRIPRINTGNLTLTVPYIPYTALFGDTNIWLLQQKEKLDQMVWMRIPTTGVTDSQVGGFEFEINKAQVSANGTSNTNAINTFNATSPVWDGFIHAHFLSNLLPNAVTSGHNNYTDNVTYWIARYLFQFKFNTGSSLKCLKSLYAYAYRPEIGDNTPNLYENNDNIGLEYKWNYYIEDSISKTMNTALDSSQYYLLNSLTSFSVGHTRGYAYYANLGEHPLVFLKFNVTGGFTFVPNIII